MRNIGYTALLAYEIVVACIRKVLVQHAVESASLILVAVDAVGNVFGGVAGEVVGLPLHWSHAWSTSVRAPCLWCKRSSGGSVIYRNS